MGSFSFSHTFILIIFFLLCLYPASSRPGTSNSGIRDPRHRFHVPRRFKAPCYGARIHAVRDCKVRYRRRGGMERKFLIVPCVQKPVRRGRRRGAQGWMCAMNKADNDDPYDVNSDQAVDQDDLVYLLRAIDDPLNEVQTGADDADLDGDGDVDFDDANTMIGTLIERNGAASIAPLTTEYERDHVFDWNQETLSLAPDVRTVVLGSILGVRQAQTCGTPSVASYKKGSGPDVSIPWDNGYTFNSLARATAADYYNWAKYTTLLRLAQASFQLSDGTRAYSRYRDASGAELTVDYEKAIRDDSSIRAAVDAELSAVKDAVTEMFDGEESSFEFHSTGARLVNSATENWQKALGGHRIWSVGSVSYNAASCELAVDITVKIEDFYNFNKGQVDIATGLPDNDNGRFEVLGWAKSFFSRGEIKRSQTIKLQCCDDTDCGDPTQFECECSKCTTQCPTQQRSGGQGFTSFTVDLKKTSGVIQVQYEMYSIPDQLSIKYEGQVIFSTPGLVSGSSTQAVQYGSSTSTSTVVSVEVNAPQSGTAWVVSVSCPP